MICAMGFHVRFSGLIVRWVRNDYADNYNWYTQTVCTKMYTNSVYKNVYLRCIVVLLQLTDWPKMVSSPHR